MYSTRTLVNKSRGCHKVFISYLSLPLFTVRHGRTLAKQNKPLKVNMAGMMNHTCTHMLTMGWHTHTHTHKQIFIFYHVQKCSNLTALYRKRKQQLWDHIKLFESVKVVPVTAITVCSRAEYMDGFSVLSVPLVVWCTSLLFTGIGIRSRELFSHCITPHSTSLNKPPFGKIGVMLKLHSSEGVALECFKQLLWHIEGILIES